MALPNKVHALRDPALAALLGCDLDSPEFDEKVTELARVVARKSAGGRRPLFDALAWLRRHRA